MRKKILSAISLSLVGGLAVAQLPQITFTGQVPVIGDTVEYRVVDTDAFGFQFDPVGTGSVTDKEWDALSSTSKGIQQFIYNDPAGTTFGAMYPLATHALSYAGVDAVSGWEYYRYSNDSIIRYSLTNASAPQIWYWETGVFDNSFARSIFPMDPGDSWNSNYSGGYVGAGVGEDSSKVEDGTYSASVAAVGSLILPALNFGGAGEQFDDVVLVFVQEAFDINLYVVGTPLTIEISEIYYAWYKEGIQDPILIYYETTDDQTALGGGVTTTTVMKYQPLDGADPTGDTIVDAISERLLENHVNVYPNPATDVVNVEITTPLSGTASLTISNVLGQELISRSGSELSMGTNIIDVNTLDNGIFFVTIKDDNQRVIKKITIK